MNVSFLPCSFKSEFLIPCATISKPKCDELSGFLPSLLAPKFSLAPLLQIIHEREVHNIDFMISVNSDMLLLQKQTYVLMLMTGAFLVTEFKPSLANLQPHLYLFIFSVVSCNYVSKFELLCNKL